ncbi:hypothetical protein RDI58_007683 [Solanum bulbocastanum]|uniref:Uncharacterized protein n=1 Tax=Solanum bulbocastanum TaxID=147425 RepID=A0AAN8YIW2_SOLBU
MVTWRDAYCPFKSTVILDLKTSKPIEELFTIFFVPPRFLYYLASTLLSDSSSHGCLAGILVHGEKNVLLLRRRLKNREATTRHLLANTNSLNAIKSTCVTKENLYVECSSSISQGTLCLSRFWEDWRI